MTTPPRFTAEEFPHGLRCMDCADEFVEGQPYSRRLTDVDTCDDLADVFGGDRADALFYTELTCVPCALKGATHGP